jgi:hypothetical protein
LNAADHTTAFGNYIDNTGIATGTSYQAGDASTAAGFSASTAGDFGTPNPSASDFRASDSGGPGFSALDFDAPDVFSPLDIGGRYYCQWLDCNASFGRRDDWYRHFQSKHFNVRWFCNEPGCEKAVSSFKGYCRQDKVKKHINDKHAGSMLTGVFYFC